MTPLVLDGEYVVEVASGVTVEFSGEISGTGPLRKTGAGTLVLSNGNNTFTEGVQISQGYVRADKEGCLGDGMIHIDGTLDGASVGVTRQINFNANGATFANEILVEGKETSGYNSESAFVLSSAGVATKLTGPVTFTVSGDKVSVASGTSTSKTGSLTFANSFTYTGGYLRTVAYGDICFSGPITNGTLSIMYNAALCGAVTFESPRNKITSQISLRGAHIVARAENVLGDAPIFNISGTEATSSSGYLDLAGFNQRVGSLNCTASAAYIKTSSGAATLKLTGTSANKASSHILSGALSLVLDAAAYPNFTQTLSGASTMTGVLAVSNGTLTVSGTFKKVPEVHVGPSGKMVVSGSTAFAGARKLVVDGVCTITGSAPFASDNSLEIWLGNGEDTALTVSSDLRVKNVYLWDGEKYNRVPNGDHADGTIPHLSGASVNIDNGEEEVVEATWTAGGDENRSIAEVSNWDVSADRLDFSNGKLLATFASAGEVADVDQAVKFLGLRFTRSFTLAKANGSAAVEIGGEGVAASAGAYEIAAPVTLPVAQTWILGTDATVRISDGVSVDPTGLPNVAGAGAFELAGESVFGNGAAISNRTVCLSGLIATPDRVPDGPAAYWSDATGWTPYESSLRVYANAWGEDSSVSISNLVSEKALWIRGPENATSTRRSWFNVAPGSTNEFRAGVYFSSYIGYVTVPSDACLRFRKGLTLAATTHWTGGTLDFQGGAFGAGTGSGVYLSDVNVRLHGAGGDGKYRMESGSSFDCFCDLAITNAYLCFYASTRVSLHGHVIHAKQMELSSGRPTIESDEPATLVVGYDKNGVNSSFKGQINGCVSVVKNGAGGTLTISDCAAATTGDLSVVGTGNVLTLAADASWLNGTNVTVASTSTLKLQGRRQFNSKFAVLHIDDSGIVDLAEGTTQRFHEMYVDGVKVEPGVYGSAEAEGVDHTYAAHFAGKGIVKVGDFGLVLMVR